MLLNLSKPFVFRTLSECLCITQGVETMSAHDSMSLGRPGRAAGLCCIKRGAEPLDETPGQTVPSHSLLFDSQR